MKLDSKRLLNCSKPRPYLLSRNNRNSKSNWHRKKNLAKQDQEKKTLDSAQDARKKTLLSLESTLKADQKSLAVMKRNETLLRSKIAKAEREAKVRAQREAKEAARIRAKQRQAQQKALLIVQPKMNGL